MVDRPMLEAKERVRDLPDAWRRAPSVVQRGEPLSRAVETLLANPAGRAVYVVEPDGRLAGVVSFRSLVRVAAARYGATTPTVFSFLKSLRDVLPERVEDLMRPASPVRADSTLQDALFLMESGKENDLPIVDGDGRLVGELNGLQVMALALRVLREGEAALDASRAAHSGAGSSKE